MWSFLRESMITSTTFAPDSPPGRLLRMRSVRSQPARVPLPSRAIPAAPVPAAFKNCLRVIVCTNAFSNLRLDQPRAIIEQATPKNLVYHEVPGHTGAELRRRGDGRLATALSSVTRPRRKAKL